MPSLGSLSDQQIADVLSFVRKPFSANESSVSADDVKQVREANLNRQVPWTGGELKE